MEVRESKLLIIAVLSAGARWLLSPLAWQDDGRCTNNNGDSVTNGGDTPAGGDSGRFTLGDSGGTPGDSGTSGGDSEQDICQDIGNKITSCSGSLVCPITSDEFVTVCLQAGTVTGAVRDDVVSSQCEDLNIFCPFTQGACTDPNVCVTFDGDTAICETSDGGNTCRRRDLHHRRGLHQRRPLLSHRRSGQLLRPMRATCVHWCPGVHHRRCLHGRHVRHGLPADNRRLPCRRGYLRRQHHVYGQPRLSDDQQRLKVRGPFASLTDGHRRHGQHQLGAREQN